MSTGFTFPWEKAAMHGEELPEGLSLPDQMAYTCLRNIYFLYYNKTISRDQAAAEKQRVPQSGTDEMESYDKITAGMGKPLYSPHESSLPVSA